MEHRFILRPYKKPSDRVKCPSCGRPAEFSHYVDKATGELLNDLVGRCNRSWKCGYHKKPKEYFKEGGVFDRSISFVEKPIDVKPIEHLPVKYLEEAFTIDKAKETNLYKFLDNEFWWNDIVLRTFGDYYVGGSDLWKGANFFPQVDINGFFRQAKIILYNPETGKRVRSGAAVQKKIGNSFYLQTTEQDCAKVYGKYLGHDTKHLNLEQCFFGEHLISEYPNKIIALVESEKTAMIMSIYNPEFIWIATGGSHGCKWNSYNVAKVFQGRKVVLFPDLSTSKTPQGKTVFQVWGERAKQIQEQVKCSISVSDLLEKKALPEHREAGFDIADFMLYKPPIVGL